VIGQSKSGMDMAIVEVFAEDYFSNSRVSDSWAVVSKHFVLLQSI
jgi:hypothetical protein